MTLVDAQTILEKSQLRPGRHTWWARVPFAATVVGGGAILLALKAADVSQALVTGAAVLLMLAYATIVYRTPILRLREDQLADNCYYLGFLFTLISLSWALFKFASTGSDVEIVSSFGLALGSTIVGVLLRVTINQARKDVIEVEADARMELAQSVIRLRVQIDDAVLAMSSFHKQTEQVARDAIQNAAESAATALESSVAKVGDASTRVMERIDEAFAEFTENAQQLNAASAGTVRGLKGLLTRIENIEAPSDLLLRRIEPVVASLEEASGRLQAVAKSDEIALTVANRQSREIAEQFAATMELFSSLQQSIELASHQSAKASEAAHLATEKFAGLLRATEVAINLQRELAETARQRGDAISDAASAQLDELIRVFQRHNQSMETELERFRRAVEGSGDTFADLASSLNTPIIVPRQVVHAAVEGHE